MMRTLWRTLAAVCLLLGMAPLAVAETDARFVSRWFGEIEQANGDRQQWINDRRSDQTYHVEFRIFRKCRLVGRQIESGTWQFSGGVLKQIATRVAGRPSYYRDLYSVISLENGRLEYAHIGHGVRYVAWRVPANFRFPGCNYKKGKGPLTS